MLSYELLIVWFVILASHFFVTRSRQCNEPTKTVEDIGDELIIRPTAYRMLFSKDDITIKKVNVENIQRAKHTVSLFMKGGNAYDIWVAGKFTDELFKYVQSLLPHAGVIIIQSDGSASKIKEYSA
jgi:hypothetical protein